MLNLALTLFLQTIGSVTKSKTTIIFALVASSIFLSGCEAGIYHTVKPGQTLYRISHTYAVNEKYLARINNISNPAQLPVGTRLFVPGANRVLNVQVVTPKKPTKPVILKKKTLPSSQQQSVAKKTKPPTSVNQLKKMQATQLKKLQWPLRGKIVRSFSNKAKAGRGRGIEISVRTGSKVAAAAAGKVIYSGDGISGYAYLIILQHENDLFTVYGFNRKNLVRQGDFVSQGEPIALSGTPPTGGVPRLHFEVRRGKTAKNPMLYLP